VSTVELAGMHETLSLKRSLAAGLNWRVRESFRIACSISRDSVFLSLQFPSFTSRADAP